MEFSHGILKLNKPGGILTLLDSEGKPMVSPLDDLSTKTIVDVTGWAPTSDTIPFCMNSCSGAKYGAPTMVASTSGAGTGTGNANDDAMIMLQTGQADAIWIYSDQAFNYNCTYSNLQGITPSWNCSLWEGFGTKYAYVGTGLEAHAANGTTLTMSRKGSGIPDIVNPCIQKYLESEDYYKV